MKSQGEAGEEPQRTDSPAQQTGAETQEEAFDEPDDELEEFDEIGGEVPVDAELKQWSEDWDAAGSVAEQELCDKLFYPKGETIIIWCAGWDDEDPDDEFLEHLQRELEAFKTAYASRTAQTRKAA